MSNNNPKYQCVYENLKEMLADYEDGQRLPSFSTMCKHFSISLATLNSALDLLEKDGLIRRMPKVGIFCTRETPSTRRQKITLLMPGGHEPLFSAVIETCGHFCQRNNIELSLEFSELNPDCECRIISKLIHDDTCDGLLFLPLYPMFKTPESLDALKRLAAEKPVIQFDRELGQGNTSFFGYDCYHDCYQAVKHLITLGHRSIGLVCASNDDLQHPSDRIKAYFDALQDAHLTYSPKHTIVYNVLQPDLANDVIEIMSSPDCPTAYYFVNSVFIPRFMRKAHFLKKAIPRDFSIICYDLADVFENLPLNMTFYDEPVRETVQAALEQLVLEMSQPTTKPVRRQFPGTFVQGESCRHCSSDIR